jgi:CAAX prenyl protease-like protein
MTSSTRSDVAREWSWQWMGWASWRVTPTILVTAAFAVVVDMVSAWTGRPEWYLGRVLVSPALPAAVLLVGLVGWECVGASRRMVLAWREYVVGGTLVVAAAIVGSVHAPASTWQDVEGVTITAAGEEVVYRLAAVLVVGALCAWLLGRNWRDTQHWGTGPIVVALVTSAVLFTALPGHVAQMTGVTSAVPFASLAMLLGYTALRTGSLLPGMIVHVLLDIVTLTFLAGAVSASSRALFAATALTALMLGLMMAGRRLGFRRCIPAVIDLRESPDVSSATRVSHVALARTGSTRRPS